jgi:vacuolar protein 8
MNGLTLLIRRMNSSDVKVQCNAVHCMVNLATHEENIAEIAKSGALCPLVKLATSTCLRAQQNAIKALLLMTCHSGMLGLGPVVLHVAKSIAEIRQQLINAGALPALLPLLSSTDLDV